MKTMQYESSCVAYVGYAATVPPSLSVMQTAMASFAFAMSMIVWNLKGAQGKDSNCRRN